MMRSRIGLKELGGGRCRGMKVGPPSVLALRHDDDVSTVLCLANLVDEEVTVDLPEDLADLVDVLADGAYPPTRGNRRLTVRGYGYRWLRRESALLR